jgi:hypothetical protein
MNVVKEFIGQGKTVIQIGIFIHSQAEIAVASILPQLFKWHFGFENNFVFELQFRCHFF